jgi:hypothetical protein
MIRFTRKVARLLLPHELRAAARRCDPRDRWKGWIDRASLACRRALVQQVYGRCVYPIEQRLRTVPNPLRAWSLARSTPADMAPLVAELRREGIVFLPGYLSGERLAACQRDFEELVERIRTGPPTPRQPMPWRYFPATYTEHEHHVPGVEMTYSCDPFRSSKALLDVVLDEHLLGIVARYFNRKFKMGEAGIHRIYPMPPRDFSSFQWHHDGLGPHVKVMALLTDVGPNDQYMSYLKGTHRMRHGYHIHDGKSRISLDDIATRFARYEKVDCTGPAGTVIVFDDNGIHRGNRNQGAVRDNLVGCYCPGSTSWPLHVPRAHVAGLSPFQREVLLGNLLARAI